MVRAVHEREGGAAIERRSVQAVLLAAILGLGLGVRLLGIRMGLPFHHHWDEGWIVDSAADMLRHGNDVPRSYQHGEPLMRLTELTFLALRGLRPPFDLTTEDAQVTLFLIARVLSAAITSSGVVAIYATARLSEPSRPRAARVALASALMYGVAWEFVLHSRYGMADACVVGLIAWILASSAAYAATRNLVWAAASIILVGVAGAFKLPGSLTLVMPIATLLAVRPPSSRGGRLLYRLLLVAAVPIVLGEYVFFNPHVIDRAGDAARDIVGRMKQTHDGGASAVYLRQPGLPHLASALWAIATHFLHRTVVLSLVMTAVTLKGLVFALKQKRTMVAVALLYAVALVLSVALPNRVLWIRYYIGVIPCMSLGFGYGVVRLVEDMRVRFATRPGRRVMATAAIVVATGLALVVAPLGYAMAAEKMQPDTRTQAIDWIAAHAPAGGATQVALTPNVFGKGAQGNYPGLNELEARPNLRFAPSDLEACPASNGPDYIVDASYQDLHKADPSDVYAPLWLFETCPGYERVASFEPDPYEYDAVTQPNWVGRVSAVVLRRGDR